MNLQERADQIALQVIKQNSKYGLREPPEGEVAKRIEDCLDQLKTLLRAELGTLGLVEYAAAATYRANVYEQRTRHLSDQLGRYLKEMDLAEAGSVGNAKVAHDALIRLGESDSWLISRAVAFGQSIERKLKASAGGKRGKEKYRELEAFAIKLFEAEKSWKSTLNARDILWPKIQAEAARQGTPLSPDTGPITLYGWLLKHVKTTRQLVDIQR